MPDGEREFRAILEAGPRGSGFLRLPFDPAEAWSKRRVYRVAGRLGWFGVRGSLVQKDGDYLFPLGAAWLRDCPIHPGMEVAAVLWPEGPQLDGLDEDVAAVLAAEPEAAEFFEALAQFYRKAYLKWLDGAKRRPEVRRQRLAEFVSLLKQGRKSRD